MPAPPPPPPPPPPKMRKSRYFKLQPHPTMWLRPEPSLVAPVTREQSAPIVPKAWLLHVELAHNRFLLKLVCKLLPYCSWVFRVWSKQIEVLAPQIKQLWLMHDLFSASLSFSPSGSPSVRVTIFHIPSFISAILHWTFHVA